MKKVKLIVGKRTFEGILPESFGQMTPEEFLYVVRYRCDVISRKILIEALLGLKHTELPLWAVVELQPYIEYVNTLDEKLDHFILPHISTGFFRGKYIAPKARLSGMSLQQFMAVDNFFQFYTSTQREEFLYKMVACLYLRQSRSFFGKKILDFDKETKRLNSVDTIVILAIYLNWILIKNWLSQSFKHLFASGSSDAKKSKGTDWLEVFDSFVGDHVADMIAYQKMECMDAFRIMNNKIKESKRHERNQ